MRRRDKPGGKAGKPQRPKTLKCRNARKAGRGRNPSAIDATKRIELLTRERAAALEREAATAEVLKVISRSTFDLKAVLETLVQSAGKLCQAENVQIYLRDGEFYRLAADNGFSPEYQQYVREHPIRPGRGTLVARTALGVVPVQIPDRLADPEYTYHEGGNLGGYRTMLGVPLVRDGSCIGVIALTRSKVRPFTDKQIELVKNFAAQAVIAIENTRLLNEQRESLERQTATSEVLQAIASSPGELEPVFNAMLANATRLCEATFGHLWLFEGNTVRGVATHSKQTYADYRRANPVIDLRDHPGVPLDRLAKTKQVVHIPDLRADQSYIGKDDRIVSLVEVAGARTFVVVPLLKESELIGAIGMYRQEVRPFTDKQIELVKNFAAQAVIAIENTRLLNELRQRTDDLSESLEQQTATSEVLKAISSSAGELEPVFQTMLANATRICEAAFGSMLLSEGELLRRVATHNPPPMFAEFHKNTPIIDPRKIPDLKLVVETKQPVHVVDAAAENLNNPIVKYAGARSLLVVPLLKDGDLLGAIGIYRQEVRPFTNKQIELVTNFAAQAVIAIENARLLSELRQRTGDLSEALEQQTATSEVLQVISSSPGELEPVFNAMLANATRICEAAFGHLWLFEGDAFRAVAVHSKQSFADYLLRNPVIGLRDNPGIPLDRLAKTKQVVHIPDLRSDQSVVGKNARVVSLVEVAGVRTFILVPMLKESELIGAIAMYRQEARPFTDKQIELVQNFAAQAVIAIENARLLNELRESLQQQTATADVLKIISSSPGDLKPVFDAMLANAVRICGASFGVLFRFDEGAWSAPAMFGVPPAFAEYWQRGPQRPGPRTALGRVADTKRPVHIADVKTEPAYIEGEAIFVAAVDLGGFRTILNVPLVKENELLGAMAIYRTEVNPFGDKQIELVSNFAAQAVIAIENTRLLAELHQRTKDLSTSLENLRATQDRLVQTEKLASLGQLTAGIAHEIKNPLNFVNNFSGVSAELIDELQDTLKGVSLDNKARAGIAELTNTLRSNLEKVVQHGKRADAIVKNMLLHSRQGSGERRLIDVNALVEESFSLAYHGARAEKQSFDVMVEQSLDPAAGKADLFPQEITRVLLNLISNGVYATAKKAQANSANYKPTLTASTKSLGDRVEIKIRDNGTGIPSEIRDKMFTPFFTTKPAGEGTGLGLSISHDIIVKQHGGSIEVDTQPGKFTEFKIVLPRAAVSLGGERA